MVVVGSKPLFFLGWINEVTANTPTVLGFLALLGFRGYMEKKYLQHTRRHKVSFVLLIIAAVFTIVPAVAYFLVTVSYHP